MYYAFVFKLQHIRPVTQFPNIQLSFHHVYGCLLVSHDFRPIFQLRSEVVLKDMINGLYLISSNL